MLKTFFFILIFISSPFIFGQNLDIIDSVSVKNGISKPSILATNPFGIFISRLNHNFKKKASTGYELNLSLESGNIWGPNVKTYIPKNEAIRSQLRNIPWYSRQHTINVENLDANWYEIETDGVIKGIRVDLTLPISKKQELILGFRTFILTKGTFPFSALTSDNFIEFFHSKIAGGDDPFDRKVFGYNKARFKYIDRYGNRLDLNTGDLTFGGLESHYYYYPELLNTKKIHLNFGAHLATNLSKYNASLDLGLSFAALKQIDFNARSFMLLGLGINGLRKNTLDFKDTNMDFGTNNFIGSLENNIEYSFISKGNTTHSLGLSFYLQTSLNKKEEAEYAIHVRDQAAYNSWQHGTRHLYKNNNYWTFIYSFTRKIQTSFYLQQDFTVNNNPDLQTGIGVKFGL